MTKRLYGTRFTTGCGHSWHRPYPKWTARDLGHVTTDCVVCGELLIIPAEQFEGCDLDQFPINVHAPLFHKYLNQQDSRWPTDGAGTGYVEFTAEGE
jgi:hypothetical protein